MFHQETIHKYKHLWMKTQLFAYILKLLSEGRGCQHFSFPASTISQSCFLPWWSHSQVFSYRDDVRSFFITFSENSSATYIYSQTTEDSGAWHNYREAPVIHPKGIWELLTPHKLPHLSPSPEVTASVSTSAEANSDFLGTSYQNE